MNSLLLLKILIFLDFFAVAMVVPLFSNYFRDVGITSIQYSYISSVYSAAQIVGGLVVGIMGDYLSKRSILVVSFAGSAISYLIIGYSQSYALLFFSRVLVGIVKHSYTTTSLMISELTHDNPKERGKELSQLSAALSAAFAVGPSIGGLLYKQDNHYPVLAAMLIFIVNIVLVLMMLPSSRGQRQPVAYAKEKSAWSLSSFFSLVSQWRSWSNEWRQALGVCSLQVLMSFVMSSMGSHHIMNYFQDRFHLETYQLGFLSSMTTGCRLLSQAFCVGYITRFFDNDAVLILFCLFLTACTNLGESIAWDIYVYIAVAAIPDAIIGSVMETANKTWLLSSVPSIHHGSIFSGMNVIMSGIGVLSPIYGSYVFAIFDGVKNRGIISAVHYLFMAVVGYLLYQSFSYHPTIVSQDDQKVKKEN